MKTIRTSASPPPALADLPPYAAGCLEAMLVLARGARVDPRSGAAAGCGYLTSEAKSTKRRLFSYLIKPRPSAAEHEKFSVQTTNHKGEPTVA